MKNLRRISLIIIFSLVTFCMYAVDSKNDKNTPNTELKIYPNPVTNNLFTISSEKELIEVKVLNVLGQQVYQEKIFNEKIFRVVLNTNEKGVYIVQIKTSDNDEMTKRVLFK